MVKAGQFAAILLTLAALVTMFAPFQSNGAGSVLPDARRKPMPDFILNDLQGGKWNLAEHRGRVVLVNFWASWCGPCRQEIPGFLRLSKNHPQLDIAGIVVNDEEPEVRQYVTEARMTYPVLLPPDSWPLRDVLEGLPTTFLLDKQGRVARKYVGAYSEKTFQGDVERLLGER